MWEKYDDEFKRDAIKKVLDGQSVRSVCQELGVNESLIHKWKRAGLKIGDGQRSGVKTPNLEPLDWRVSPSIPISIISDAFPNLA